MKSAYEPKTRERVIGALRAGADMAMAARAAGVSRRVLYDWRDKYPDFAEEIDEARGVADDIVIKRLFDMTTENVTACIFWLKNRRPKEWRDRHELEHSGEIKAVFVAEFDKQG